MTVGPDQPGLGCAATPTGLPITTTSSSSCTISMPSTGSATICTGAGASGISTSSQAPPCTRSDLPTTDPSTVTFPAAASSAALVREKPNMREMAASTRSPSRPSGTGRLRISGIVLTRRVCRTAATRPTAPVENPAAPTVGRAPSALVDGPVRVEPRNDSSTIRMPPHTMAESARLNTAKPLGAMKSTTAPSKTPGARKIRSVRLPSAPPSSRPSAMAQGRL